MICRTVSTKRCWKREFEKVYEQEKVKSKSLDKKVAEFREDILKVNSEKHKMNYNLKIKHEECEGFKGKVKALTVTNDELLKKLKLQNKDLEAKKAELINTNREHKSVEKDYITTKSEVEDLRLRITEVSKEVYSYKLIPVMKHMGKELTAFRDLCRALVHFLSSDETF